MRIRIAYLLLLTLAACGADAYGGGGPPSQPNMPPGDCVDNDSGCETASLQNGVCTKANLSEGTLCGGSMGDAVHGECVGGAPVCHWTEYTCKYEPTGAACIAGRCSLGECCKLCVDKDGTCQFRYVNGKLVTDGKPCP